MTDKRLVTESLCPVCFKRIEAKKIREGDRLFMVKTCPEHGDFKTVIWREGPEYESWRRPKTPAFPAKAFTQVDKGCPYDCGLCPSHRQHTCTALIEVTERCNLGCSFCFADAGGDYGPDMETIGFYYDRIMESGQGCNIQISGGEPTMREDLAQIIRLGHKKGFSFIQLNTNGLKLADYDYVLELKDTGLNSVFLQFDGLDDEIYEELRGARILEEKLKAIDNLSKAGIGTILVVTVVPGINDHCLYEIVKFGSENIPGVRGVHFQPVSYFGRIPKIPTDEDRITLPEVMSKLSSQSGGMMSLNDFKAPCCENSYCSFNGSFIVHDDKLVAIGSSCKEPYKESPEKIEDGAEGAAKSKTFVERNWAIRQQRQDEDKYASFSKLLDTIENNRFAISAMGFMDAWDFDTERIRDCCIHVVSKEGNMIPFCAYNVTNMEGKSLYR